VFASTCAKFAGKIAQNVKLSLRLKRDDARRLAAVSFSN
jgi:hypothetical protein